MNREQRAALQAKTEAIRAQKALKAEKPSVAERVIERLTAHVEEMENVTYEKARQMGRPEQLSGQIMQHLAPPEPPKERKPQRPWTPKANDRAIMAKGRLPDGAQFTAVYDAANTLWNGMLTIPEVKTFSGRSSGIFQLLHSLDDAYRAHLEGQK